MIGRINSDPFGRSVRWTLLHRGEVSTLGGTDVADGLYSLEDPPSSVSERLGSATVRDGVGSVADGAGPVADGTGSGGDDTGLLAEETVSAVADGLHWVADRFVQAYGFVGGARTVRLVVRDVSTLDDYGRVLSYLEGLSALQTIDVEAYEDDGGLLVLRASARGDLSVIEQMVSLGRVLRLDERASSSVDNTLVLTLAGGSRR